jgi:subtilisin family serine protease
MREPKVLTANAASGEPEGVNSYPEYRALWALDAVGVLDGTDSYASAAWDAAQAAQEAGRAVTVALIDTSVAWEHPCLGAVDLVRMVDFSVVAEGAFVVPRDALPSQADKDARDALQLGPVEGRSTSFAGFSGHGTAMAGLIAGQPETITLHVPARSNRAGFSEATTREVMLPYAGVNPFCRLVPISTSSHPDPKMLMAAFDYADAIDADVIVLAIDLIPPVETPDAGAQVPPTAADFDQAVAAALNADRQRLADRIEAIGQTRFIVCAAGNSGRQ